jgi:hypothetical protein
MWLRQSELPIAHKCKKGYLMGTELMEPFFSVLLILLGLLGASYSSAVTVERLGLLNSVVLGMCVGTVFVLAAIVVGWRLF